MAAIAKKVLLDGTSLTATTTSDPVVMSNNSDKLIGFIKTANQNAATTVAGKIQHSPNGDDWFDLLTFTNIVGATPSSELKLPVIDSVTVDKCMLHVRAVATLSGATQASDVTIELYYDPNK